NGPSPWRERFAGFLDQVQQGAAWRSAWAAALDGVSPDEAEAAFRKYLVRESTVLLMRPYSPPAIPLPPTSQVHVMSPAEVHVLHARLRTWDATGMPQAERDLEAAAATAPTAFIVLLTRGLLRARQGRLEESERDLLAASERSPGDARPWVALYRVRSRLA